MGALLSLFGKKHATVDLECKGCQCHADDKSSSSSEEPSVAQQPKKLRKDKE